MNMRHIQSFNSAADVQAALDNEQLGKPYVALVSGSGLDYNSLAVTDERKIEITFDTVWEDDNKLWNNINSIPLDYAEWVDGEGSVQIRHADDDPTEHMPDGVTKVTYHLTGNTIGARAFDQISSHVTKIEIYGGVEYLGSYSFNGISNDKFTGEMEIILHEGLKEIGYNDGGSDGYLGRTFEAITGCTHVIIPSTVTLVNTNSFANFENRIFEFKGTTPPTFSMAERNDLGYLPSVYVPDQALEAYQDVLGDYVYHINECYVVDSDGTRFLPNHFNFNFDSEEGEYSFNFETDVDATWTLYLMGNVVTASSASPGVITWYQDCNGQATSVEQISVKGAPIANIAPSTPISYDEPIQHITDANFHYGDGAYNFDANIYIPYCGEDPSTSGSAS